MLFFSLQYTVARALLNQSVKPEHFNEESIQDPQINDLIKKIKVLTDLPDGKLPSFRLKAVLKNGKEITESCDFAKGDQLNNPISRQVIKDKFWMNVEYSHAMTKEKAKIILSLLENLEEIANIEDLISTLV